MVDSALRKFSLRPTTLQDLEKLRGFLARAFGVGLDAPFVNPALLAWKYWDPRQDWSSPRSYVLEQGDAIVAHAGLWPMTFGSGADAVQGLQMIDWAAARTSPGAGLILVRKLAEMFDFIYSIGGSDMTRRVLPAFGFVEHTQVWHGVRPIRPFRQILAHQARNWKLLPRLARNWWWGKTENWNSPQNWSAREIEPRDILQDFLPCVASDAIFSPRPPAFFEYLQRCPSAQFKLYGIFEDHQLKGHFAMSLVRGQARAAGLWLQDSGENWTHAYALIRQTALQLREANEIVVIGSEGPSRSAAAQAGFRILPGPPVYMLR